MHADDRTLVALCADLRACGAAMPTAVSSVATCAAKHSLNVNADGSGAALFCIASHGQSDEDTADHRLGGGNPRVKSHLVRLLGNAIDRHFNFCLHVIAAAGQTVPRRRQLRLARPSTPCDPFLLDASTVRCTTAARQSHRVRLPLTSTAWRCGTATAAQHRSSHAYQRRILLSTWPPIQHRCGGSLCSAHPNSTNASHVSVVLRTCVAQSAWKPHLRQYLGRQRRPFRCREMQSSRNCDASAATGGSPRTTSVPLMLSTEFSLGTLRAAAGWASSDHGTPRTPWRVSDDRPLKRPATFWGHVSGSAALPLDSPDSGAPCGASPHSCWRPRMHLPSGVSCH
ncbi:hypothetical protein TCDM_11888 [Trypanosoma cruzi Dm28c]|uniref:Uncharacterized protein n=1 Tax=Trypanosoma cruzi Dm28c TaxID=1416333 RepID=V5AZB6_TRYCR|nr:hypothetical protein TCDM_11888 [Trypanosoma cruzi Dm28c]